MLRFAFNTYGCPHHRLDDALELVAESGYQGVALALDLPHFDPFADDFEAAAERLAARLGALDLAITIDAGARFLLNFRERGEPSLLHPTAEGRARRLDYLGRAMKVAAICGAEAVTFATGRPKRGVSQADAGGYLLDGLVKVADMGRAAGVTVALRPEPGQMIARLDDARLVREAIRQATDAPLHLALSTAGTAVAADRDPAQAAKEFAPLLAAVALGDVRRGEVVALGTGELNIPAVLAALDAAGCERLIAVDMPRDGLRADETIPGAMDFLQENLPSD